MIVDMIVTFLGTQVGRTLTAEVANGLVLLVHAAVEHHANTAVAAARASEPASALPPR